MSKDNAITVKSYNDEFQTYIDKTANIVTGSIREFIDSFLGYLDKNATILEIGSGAGRDADYIEKSGYKSLLRTDAAENFVNYMIKRGHPARLLNIVNDTLDQKFDAVLANAVFLHFNDDDFDKALKNTKAMLENGGIFAVSLHEGAFRGMSDHKHTVRYFQEWTEEDIRTLLPKYGFSALSCIHGISVSGRKEWIMFIAQLQATASVQF